jgi:hypothetical protein
MVFHSSPYNRKSEPTAASPLGLSGAEELKDPLDIMAGMPVPVSETAITA